jgi:hypothetical protein
VAVLTWLVTVPLAFYLPTRLARDPFATGATVLPLAVAFAVAGAGLTGAALARRPAVAEAVAGAAAGLAAGWVALTLRLALTGTPFGFGGLIGDMSRTTASATRYTTTLASSDTLLPELPAEYPPLYTWLAGRAAVLLDQPAWRLLADFEVLFMSAALLAGFLLWRRLVPAWLALLIAGLALVTWSDPRKAYEVLTLAIFVPWVIEVFGRPTRPRLPWPVAGLVGGLIALTYPAWLVYAAPGVLALALLTWRSEPNRWAYLRRLALIGGVALTVASWYVLPYLWALVTVGGEQVSDRYVSASINEGWFPFLGGSPLAVLQLAGLVGLVWLARPAPGRSVPASGPSVPSPGPPVWWARPILLIVAGAYAYRLAAVVRYLATGHTGFLHYTARLYEVALTIAGVLVLTHLAPAVVRRLRLGAPPLAGAATLALALAWAADTFTVTWLPEHGNRYAVAAHTEPLPDGGYPRYAPAQGRRGWFPAEPVRQVVEGELGPDPRPVTLAVDDRLFAYLPWPGYLDNDRTAGSTLSRWDERYAQVRSLADVADPDRFAAASAGTRFGPIDVFVLRAAADGWRWRDQRFNPAQFAAEHWAVRSGLPGGIVVAVRRQQ